MWEYFLIFAASCVVLVRSGVWVVKALIRISKFLKLREFVVASFLMAFSTSLPELFVGITSAVSNKPQLVVGTIIGSNIVALTVMMGLGALFGKNLNIKGKVLQRATMYGAIYSLLPLVLMSDGTMSQKDGAILLAGLVYYFYQIASEQERFTKVFNNQIRGWKYFKIFVKDMFLFLAGVVVLLVSAEGIVYSASRLASALDLSLVVIGASLVALGTSLPEITFETRAVMMGHKTMILGDIIGSVVVNSSLVLGLVGLVSPFAISDFSPYLIGVVFTILTCFFFEMFARSGRKITEREAIGLLGIYVLFVIAELFLK